MDRPIVSIIIPVYNVENYISKAVASITAQTLTNWELFLVDDGSIDNSGTICDQLAADDDRIFVIHQENQGAAIARNTAIDEARGKYLFFMDADDWATEGMLYDLVSLAENYEFDAWAGVPMDNSKRNLQNIGRLTYKPDEMLADVPEDRCAQMVISGFFIETYYSDMDYYIQKQAVTPRVFASRGEFREKAHELFDRNLLYTPWNKLYLASYIRENKIYFPNVHWDDFPFNLEVIRNIERVTVTDHAYYHFIRKRSDSESEKYNIGLYAKREEENKWLLDLYDGWKCEVQQQLLAEMKEKQALLAEIKSKEEAEAAAKAEAEAAAKAQAEAEAAENQVETQVNSETTAQEEIEAETAKAETVPDAQTETTAGSEDADAVQNDAAVTDDSVRTESADSDVQETGSAEGVNPEISAAESEERADSEFSETVNVEENSDHKAPDVEVIDGADAFEKIDPDKIKAIKNEMKNEAARAEAEDAANKMAEDGIAMDAECVDVATGEPISSGTQDDESDALPQVNFPSPEATEFISRRYLERIVGCVENVTNPACELTREEKFEEIKKIISQDSVQKALKIAKPKSLYMKTMLLPIKTKSVGLAYLEGTLISKVKEKNIKLFAWLKANR